MLVFIQNHETFHYVQIGEEDYLNSLKIAKENDYPLPKPPLIKHESIDTAIIYTLVNSNEEKNPGKLPDSVPGMVTGTDGSRSPTTSTSQLFYLTNFPNMYAMDHNQTNHRSYDPERQLGRSKSGDWSCFRTCMLIKSKKRKHVKNEAHNSDNL